MHYPFILPYINNKQVYLCQSVAYLDVSMPAHVGLWLPHPPSKAVRKQIILGKVLLYRGFFLGVMSQGIIPNDLDAAPMSYVCLISITVSGTYRFDANPSQWTTIR